MNSEKYIGLDVHQATIVGRGDGFQGQVSDGIHPGNRKPRPFCSSSPACAELCR